MEKEETKREQEKEEGEGGRERDSWFLNKEKEKMTKGWVIGMESPDARDKDKTNISPLQMAVYQGRAQHRRCSGTLTGAPLRGELTLPPLHSLSKPWTFSFTDFYIWWPKERARGLPVVTLYFILFYSFITLNRDKLFKNNFLLTGLEEILQTVHHT